MRSHQDRGLLKDNSQREDFLRRRRSPLDENDCVSALKQHLANFFFQLSTQLDDLKGECLSLNSRNRDPELTAIFAFIDRIADSSHDISQTLRLHKGYAQEGATGTDKMLEYYEKLLHQANEEYDRAVNARDHLMQKFGSSIKPSLLSKMESAVEAASEKLVKATRNHKEAIKKKAALKSHSQGGSLSPSSTSFNFFYQAFQEFSTHVTTALEQESQRNKVSKEHEPTSHGDPVRGHQEYSHANEESVQRKKSSIEEARRSYTGGKSSSEKFVSKTNKPLAEASTEVPTNRKTLMDILDDADENRHSGGEQGELTGDASHKQGSQFSRFLKDPQQKNTSHDSNLTAHHDQLSPMKSAGSTGGVFDASSKTLLKNETTYKKSSPRWSTDFAKSSKTADSCRPEITSGTVSRDPYGSLDSNMKRADLFDHLTATLKEISDVDCLKRLLEVQKRYEEYLVSLRNLNLTEVLRTDQWDSPNYFKGIDKEQGLVYYPFKLPGGSQHQISVSSLCALEWGAPHIDDTQWSLMAYETLSLVYQLVSELIEFDELDRLQVGDLRTASTSFSPTTTRAHRRSSDTVKAKKHNQINQDMHQMLNSLQDILLILRIKLQITGQKQSLLSDFLSAPIYGQWNIFHHLDIRYRLARVYNTWSDPGFPSSALSAETAREWGLRQLHLVYASILWKMWRLMKFIPDALQDKSIFQSFSIWSKEKSGIHARSLPLFSDDLDQSCHGQLNLLVSFFNLSLRLLSKLSLGAFQQTYWGEDDQEPNKLSLSKQDALTHLERLIIVMSCMGSLDHSIRLQLSDFECKAPSRPDRVLSRGRLLTPHHRPDQSSIKGAGSAVHGAGSKPLAMEDYEIKTLKDLRSECHSKKLDLYWAYEPAIVHFFMVFLWKSVVDSAADDFLHVKAKNFAVALMSAASLMQLQCHLTKPQEIVYVPVLSLQSHVLCLAKALWESAVGGALPNLPNDGSSVTHTACIPTKPLTKLVALLGVQSVKAFLTELAPGQAAHPDKSVVNLMLTANTSPSRSKPKNGFSLNRLLETVTLSPWKSLSACYLKNRVDKTLVVPAENSIYLDAYDPCFCMLDLKSVLSDNSEAVAHLEEKEQCRRRLFGDQSSLEEAPSKPVNEPSAVTPPPVSRFRSMFQGKEKSEVLFGKQQKQGFEAQLECSHTIRESVEGISLTTPSLIERTLTEVGYGRLSCHAFQSQLYNFLCDYRFHLDPDGLTECLEIMDHMSVAFVYAPVHIDPCIPELSDISLTLPLTQALSGPSPQYDLYRHCIAQSMQALVNRLFMDAKISLNRIVDGQAEASFDLVDQYVSASQQLIEEFRGEFIFYAQRWQQRLPCHQHALIAIHSTRVAFLAQLKDLTASSVWPDHDIPPNAPDLFESIHSFERLVRDILLMTGLDLPTSPDLFAPFQTSLTDALRKRLDALEVSLKKTILNENYEIEQNLQSTKTTVDVCSLLQLLFTTILNMHAPTSWLLACFVEFLGRITVLFAKNVFDATTMAPLMTLKSIAMETFGSLDDPSCRHLPASSSELHRGSRHRRRSLSLVPNRVGGKLMKSMGKLAEKKMKFNQKSDDSPEHNDPEQPDLTSDREDDSTRVQDTSEDKKKAKAKKSKKAEDLRSKVTSRCTERVADAWLKARDIEEEPLQILIVKLYNLRFFYDQLVFLTERYYAYTEASLRKRDPKHHLLSSAYKTESTPQNQTDPDPSERFCTPAIDRSLERFRSILKNATESCQILIDTQASDLLLYIATRFIYLDFGDEFFLDLYAECSDLRDTFCLGNLISTFETTIDRFIDRIPDRYADQLRQLVAQQIVLCWVLVIVELGFTQHQFHEDLMSLLREDLQHLGSLYSSWKVPMQLADFTIAANHAVNQDLLGYLQRFLQNLPKLRFVRNDHEPEESFDNDDAEHGFQGRGDAADHLGGVRGPDEEKQGSKPQRRASVTLPSKGPPNLRGYTEKTFTATEQIIKNQWNKKSKSWKKILKFN